MPSGCNFNDTDVITDVITIGTTSFGNFETTQRNMNKVNFHRLQNCTNKDYNCNIYKYKIIYIFFKVRLTKLSSANIYMYKQFYISLKIILSKRFLVFKTQGLHYHELTFCKWSSLQKPRYWDKS